MTLQSVEPCALTAAQMRQLTHRTLLYTEMYPVDVAARAQSFARSDARWFHWRAACVKLNCAARGCRAAAVVCAAVSRIHADGATSPRGGAKTGVDVRYRGAAAGVYRPCDCIRSPGEFGCVHVSHKFWHETINKGLWRVPLPHHCHKRALLSVAGV